MFCTRCGSEVAEGSKFCPSCGLDLSALTASATGRVPGEPTEEDVVREALKEEYEILEELGRGGMAIVYRAREKQLEREVAVKVLPFSLAFDAEFVERFQREARTAAQLEHPHIIPIYRVGRSGRVIYFVMKFLRGSSLSAVLEQRGTLPAAEIRRLLMEAASALGYAHQRGIVHRDIKPDNIMFDETGRAVVTDFGIAKAGTGTRLTGTGMAIGTPHYMSPEQARAQKLDGRSDIYSLGVVAYQCLAGKVPFDGEDAFSIGYKHITEPVPVPVLPGPDERALFEIVRKMMAKAPGDRFQTAEELIAALEGKAPSVVAQATVALAAAETAVLSRSAAGTTPQRAAARPSTPTTPVPRASPRRERTAAKRSSGVLVGMFVAVALLGGGGGGAYYYYVVLGHQPPPLLKAWLPVAPSPAPGSGSDTSEQAVVEGPAGADTGAGRDSAASAVAAGTAALPNTGTVTLEGLPARAKVTVDGEPKEGSKLVLDAGSRRIEVTAPGYERYAVTVAVRRGGDTTVVVSLKRPVPGAPGAGGAAGTQGESAPEEVCSAPGPNYNRDNACYDTPPRALVAPLVPLDERIQGTPRGVLLWVKVSEDGRPLTFRIVQHSDDPNFDRLAAGFALQIQYNPAQKNGKPVEGWTPLRLLPQPR